MAKKRERAVKRQKRADKSTAKSGAKRRVLPVLLVMAVLLGGAFVGYRVLFGSSSVGGYIDTAESDDETDWDTEVNPEGDDGGDGSTAEGDSPGLVAKILGVFTGGGHGDGESAGIGAKIKGVFAGTDREGEVAELAADGTAVLSAAQLAEYAAYRDKYFAPIAPTKSLQKNWGSLDDALLNPGELAGYFFRSAVGEGEWETLKQTPSSVFVYIPAERFESVILSYFDGTQQELRERCNLFMPSRNVYLFMGARNPAPDNVTVVGASVSGGQMVLKYELKFSETRTQLGTLTVEDTGGGFKYLSNSVDEIIKILPPEIKPAEKPKTGHGHAKH